MILFLAGLQSIPQSLYEAASIDGANEWQQFLKITLPQLRPILLLGIVINTINSLQVFPEIFTMTKGGPLGSTTTVVYYLYDTGFHKFDLGMASAVGYILFFIILLFSLAQMKILKMGEETSAD
jgi:multiple sugar transport system permease protein